jgi:phosphatidylserine decarboxylase
LYDRKTGQVFPERVYRRGWMDFLYGHPAGRLLTELIVKRRFFSRLYGRCQRRRLPTARLRAFAEEQGINLEEVEKPPEQYPSFQAFFIRRLKPGARPVRPEAAVLIAPCDGRLLAYPIRQGLVIPVKGRRFTMAELLADAEAAANYSGGLALVFRLAPADCHRFGYVDHGVQSPVRSIAGHLHSVSPLSLQANRPVFKGNARQVCTLATVGFGRVEYVEIGALTVGRIVQFRPAGGPAVRGEEKGYFEPGGSTLVLLLEHGTVVVDPDIQFYSARGIETLVTYGSQIGVKG